MSSHHRVAIAIALSLATLVHSPAFAAEPAKKPEVSRAELEQKLQDAQRRLDVAAREVADLSMSLSDDMMPRVMTVLSGPGRAVLGINVGARGDAHAEGVEVISVSPGGGAAEAGIKAGDVLTEINGKSLQRAGEDSPHERLLAEMREVKPGDKVTLAYRRDGKAATATITAQPLADRLLARGFGRTMPGVAALPAFPPLPQVAFMRADGLFGAAELVPLTPKLGAYFGTDKGLLVVRAPEDTRLKLEDGDVIVDIDGRTPSSPSHALRILTSYQAGEKLKLSVLRMKKRMSFEVTIPEGAWGREFNGARLLERGLVHGSADIMMATPATPALPAPPPAPRGDIL